MLDTLNCLPDDTSAARTPSPADEHDRLRTLETYGLAQTAPEADFDHFAAIAAELLGLPVGMVNLVGEDQVTVKGRSGTDVETVARDIAFCSHTILGEAVLSVPDLATDSRFAANPLVIDGPRFRFYAGAPLVSPGEGHRLGALCVAGQQPRPALTAHEARLLVSLASLVMDRMELRRMERLQRDSQARLDSMAEAAPGAVICADSEGFITQWNGAAERLFGWSAADAIGQTLELIVPHEMRAAHAAGLSRRAQSDHGAFRGRVVDLPALRRDGTVFPAQVSLSRWREGDKVVFGATIHDMSARRAAEDQLRFLAHYDPLTGLPNRARLTELMGEAAAADRPIGLVLLDLDGFKPVNDTLGHSAGDVLLTDVGQRLSSALPDGSCLARLGGDEFAMLLPDCDDLSAATRFAGALQSSLDPPFTVGERSFQIGACAGVALASPAEAHSLMANADLALYQAKAAGRSVCRTFDASMREAYDARLALENEVRHAALDGQFVLHFQPQVSMGNGRLIGAEALIRWQHPQRGLLPPGMFLEALEAGPLAGKVGDWTVDEACRQAALWRKQGLDLRVGVNLFAEQLRAGTIGSVVRQALGRWNLPPSALELEVTETIALVHDATLLAQLSDLHSNGVSIAFDDFGTGFASLSTLKQCPLNRIKIDRHFVSELGTSGALGGASDQGNIAIIDAIIALGHGLGLGIIAEGIETPEQAAFLVDRGCTEGQGYLFGRPSPPDVMAGLQVTMASADTPGLTKAQLSASVLAWIRGQIGTLPSYDRRRRWRS